MTKRAALFRKTCELIALDRKDTGRDTRHHFWLVCQVDECGQSMIRLMKRLNGILDAHMKEGKDGHG